MAKVYSQEQWTKCRIEYAYILEKNGTVNLKALAEKHGINYKTLANRKNLEEWNQPLSEWIQERKNNLTDSGKYNPMMCIVSFELAKTGAQNVEIYKALGVSRTVFYNWINKGHDNYKEDLHIAIIEGREFKEAEKISELDKHGQDEIILTKESGIRGGKKVDVEKEVIKQGNYKATISYLKKDYKSENMDSGKDLETMSTEELKAILEGLD